MNRREDLDELIDRVAAELMAVPSDPALAGRVAAQLENEREATGGSVRLLAGGAAVAVAVLVGLFVAGREREAREAQVAARSPWAGAAEPPAAQPLLPLAAAEPSPTAASIAPRRAATRVITHARQVPQVDALSSPELLAIAELSTAPLSIAPVVIAPLELAGLPTDDVPGGMKE